MTERELISLCANEAIERATKAWVDMVDACAGEDIPLSPRQKVLVGSALWNGFVGFEDSLAGMAHVSELLSRWQTPEDMTPIATEIERWLAEHEGPQQ